MAPHRVESVRDLGVVRVLDATPDGSVWVGTADGLTRGVVVGPRPWHLVEGLPGSVVLTCTPAATARCG